MIAGEASGRGGVGTCRQPLRGRPGLGDSAAGVAAPSSRRPAGQPPALKAPIGASAALVASKSRRALSATDDQHHAHLSRPSEQRLRLMQAQRRPATGLDDVVEPRDSPGARSQSATKPAVLCAAERVGVSGIAFDGPPQPLAQRSARPFPIGLLASGGDRRMSARCHLPNQRHRRPPTGAMVAAIYVS